MRLLDTKTGHFVEKDLEGHDVFGRPWARFKYAILSHTWDQDGEQTYGELREIQRRYEVPKSQVPQDNPTVSEVRGLSSHK